ncbi:MAG: hypothetical protein KIT22_12445, partial [Verrucomicrobiae bacterium]|nr:hypothetical protein [Verrucomicrobiae bacterium]
FTVLKWFTNSFDGANPDAALVLSGTVLYGTTLHGGSFHSGTVFRMNTDSTGYRVLKNFSKLTFGPWLGVNGEGAHPYAGVILSGSILYGAAYRGGELGFGTLFKIDLTESLTAQALGNFLILSWSNPDFILQAAPELTGIYTNVPGAASPYTNSISGSQKFFRLIGN